MKNLLKIAIIGSFILPSIAFGAGAFDSEGGGGNSFTLTNAGGNFLECIVISSGSVPTPDYNGVALTQVDSKTFVNGSTYYFYRSADGVTIPTGANTFNINGSGGILHAECATYSGVDISAPLVKFNYNDLGSATSFNVALSGNVSNSGDLVTFTYWDNGPTTITSGTGATARTTGIQYDLLDSNGGVSAGPYSGSWTTSGAVNEQGWTAEIKTTGGGGGGGTSISAIGTTVEGLADNQLSFWLYLIPVLWAVWIFKRVIFD